MGKWLNRIGGLFWHYINGILYLGFKYIAQKIQDIVNSWSTILSFINIKPWNILEDVNSKINKEKAEQIKNEILVKDDEIIADFLNQIEDINFPNISNLNFKNKFSKDSISNELYLLTKINPFNYMLTEGFSESELYNNIATYMTSNIFGLMINGNDIKNLINKLIDLIETEDADVEFPEYQLNLNIDKIMLEMLPIISNWNNLNDVTFQI